MKFTLATLAALGLTLSSDHALVNAYNYTDDDEFYTDGDEARPKKKNEDGEEIYTDEEKNNFIFGVPGTPEYNDHKTPDEIMQLEVMWEIDHDIQKFRGALQGWYRGFYKDYDWEIPQKCFGRTAVTQIYWLKHFGQDMSLDNFGKSLGLLYNLYYTFDYDCTLEDWLYDLSQFCFDHNCSPEKLLENNMGKVFQVTGALNALAAIYYEEEPHKDLHMAWFERFSDIGKSVGKLARYATDFDPKAIKDY